MAKKQTLAQAIFLAHTSQDRGLARCVARLNMLPVGGWPETQQAFRNIEDWLPAAWHRAYSIQEFIAVAYAVEYPDPKACGRYRTRTVSEANEALH